MAKRKIYDVSLAPGDEVLVSTLTFSVSGRKKGAQLRDAREEGRANLRSEPRG